MENEPSKPTTQINGNVNITNGDFVARDKTTIYGGEEALPGSGNKPAVTSRDLAGGLEHSGGDVVLGDKIIKFFQENLNIYVFRDIQQLALFLIFILFLSGGIAGAYWYSMQPPRLTGNYNIAIAQFGEIQPDGTIKPSDTAEIIRRTLFNYLDSEYGSSGFGFNVQVEQKNMPLILGNSQAEELAGRVNADIVIYGNIFVQNDRAELSPRFYVREQPDTDELTGQNELALPIPFIVSELYSQNPVNTEFRARTQILLNFTKALIYFSQNKMDAAENALQTAISEAEETSQPFAGREVIYLLGAQIQTKEENFEAANQFLDQSLSINPGYARAHLARGNIYYSQALLLNFDPKLLEAALKEYQLADSMGGNTDGAYIPIKARTAIGNIQVVQAQQIQDPDLFMQAAQNYGYVIDQYEQSKNPFLRSYACIANFGLGAAYERQGKMTEAIQAYQKARDLTDDDEFKSRIELQINALQDE